MTPLYDVDTRILHYEIRCRMQDTVLNCETVCGLSKRLSTDWKNAPNREVYNICESCSRYNTMMELAE